MKVLSRKKGMEIAISTIVTLILGVLIFSLAISLVFKWFGQAEELKAEIDKQTTAQIAAALRAGNQLVAIPISIKEVRRANAATFGVGVRNIAKQKKFSMYTSFSGAYSPQGTRISVDAGYIEENWLGAFRTHPHIHIKEK